MPHGPRPSPSLCATPPPPCDIPSGRCFCTGPWTVTRSSLRMLRRVAAFCRPLRPMLLLVLFPRSQSPAVGVPGLCRMWQDVTLARQRRPVVGAPPPPPPVHCGCLRRSDCGPFAPLISSNTPTHSQKPKVRVRRWPFRAPALARPGHAPRLLACHKTGEGGWVGVAVWNGPHHRVQRRMKSPKNEVRTGVFVGHVGHAARSPRNSVPKPPKKRRSKWKCSLDVGHRGY